MKNLKTQNNSQNNKQIGVVRQSVMYQGPIPPPEDFAKYGHILAEAPERIMTMAEKRSNASIEEERKAGKRDFIITMTVIGCTMFLIISAFSAGIFFVIAGNIGVGVSTMIASALLLWRTFLQSFFSAKQSNKENGK